MTWLAAALAVGAVWLAWNAPAGRLRAGSGERGRRAVPARGHGLLVGGGALVVAAGWLIDGPRGAVLGWVAGGTAAALGWVTLRTRAGRVRVATQDQVARGCAALAGLLRAGQDPAQALRMVARDEPLFAAAADQHRLGADVVVALRLAAQRPGGDSLAALATSWRLAERTGAAMTSALDDLAQGLSAERELRRTVTTELAATRLTGRLLSLLPAVGVGLGYTVGGDPISYLTGSGPGLACLALGTGLAVVGVVWSELLAERAGRPA